MNRVALLVLTAVILVACNNPEQVNNPPEQTTSKTSFPIIDRNMAETGHVTFTDKGHEGVLVNVQISNISPGSHGIHLHMVGRCLAPDFKSAGSHINPENKPHGLNHPEGPDNADMPNIEADETGTATYQYINSRVSLYGDHDKPAIFDDDGSALVIHANPDDGVTQPIGGAGPRIACAELVNKP